MKRKVLPLILCFMFMLGLVQPVTYADSAEVSIEDPVLRQAIRDELELDADAVLDFEALQKLKSLYPKGKEKIKSLKGLELAFNLEQLFLPGHEISDLRPLSGLYHLTFVALNNNQIKDACPLANLYQLKKLVISSNQIEEIGCFSRLHHLTDLLAGDNQIQSIAPLAKLDIGWLNIPGNPVVDITPVGAMKKLHHIYADVDKVNDESKALLGRLEQSGVAVNRGSATSDGVSGISVFVNGQRVLFDRAPLTEAGTTMVQFRPVMEKLGFTVRWDATTRTIHAEKAGVQLSLQVGQESGRWNGEPYALPTAPRNVDGHIFVPIRVVGEAAKHDVTWDSKSKSIYLMPERAVAGLDGRSRVTVSGKWLNSSFPSTGNSQMFLVNGLHSLLSFTQPKIDLEEIDTIEAYEAALKKGLESRNIMQFTDEKTMTVNGMKARQLSYNININKVMQAKVVQTIIEGKYSFFQFALFTGDEDYAEVIQEYNQILQTFEEVKTTAELSQETFGSLKPTERLLDAARYYRGLGYFEKDKGLTSRQFDDKFLAVYKQWDGEEWNPFDASEYFDDLADLYVWSQDSDRVWMEDTEADVGQGNEVYVTTLKRWSSLSRGVFQPTDLKEDWGTEEGPVTVSFLLNGQKKVIHPQYMNDFIDVDIIAELNDMIKDTGYQFVAVDLGQEVFVTVLNAEEKRKIEQERYIPFVSYEE